MQYSQTTTTCAVRHSTACSSINLRSESQPSIAQVVTPVYASPMRVAVNLDSSRASDAAPASAYPDICFAIDEFDETHQHMVRPQPVAVHGDARCLLWLTPKMWSYAEGADAAQL